MSAEYRIEYTIQRRTVDDADFAEIGFGSSGAWGSVNEAIFEVESDIQNRQWDTEPGQPEPDEVDREAES